MTKNTSTSCACVPASTFASSLQRAFSMERIKGKHSAAFKTALIAPLPCCVIDFLDAGAFGGTPGYTGFNTYGWCYWYTLMLPIAVALISAGVGAIDARQKLRPVLGQPLDLKAAWWAKVLYALALVTLSSLIVAAFSTVANLGGGSAATLGESLAIVAILSIASLWMIPAAMAATFRFSTLAGIVLPLFPQIALGILLAHSRIWWIAPPAAAMRLPSPLTDVAPSGIPLMPEDAYGIVDPAWFAGLAIAAAFGIIAAIASSIWFSKREAL